MDIDVTHLLNYRDVCNPRVNWVAKNAVSKFDTAIGNGSNTHIEIINV
jgi:hypothetical protein